MSPGAHDRLNGDLRGHNRVSTTTEAVERERGAHGRERVKAKLVVPLDRGEQHCE